MKGVLYIITIAICALSATSCLDSATTTDGEVGYADVYLGVTLYNEATNSNTLAADGLNIAMKLAILVDEMAENNLSFTTGSSAEPIWSDLGLFYFESSGYDDYIEFEKKSFLFGVDGNVIILNPSENVYTVRYYSSENYHTQAIYDELFRRGGYTITTNGKPLSQSGAVWSVEISDSKLTFASKAEQTNEIYSVSKLSTQITNSGDGVFVFEVESIINYDYPWSISGSLTIDAYRDLTIDSTVGRDYELSIDSASGRSVSGYELTYNTVEPLVYNISEVEYHEIDGVERVTVSGDLAHKFPDTTVTVETKANTSKSVTYNGNFWEP